MLAIKWNQIRLTFRFIWL